MAYDPIRPATSPTGTRRNALIGMLDQQSQAALSGGTYNTRVGSQTTTAQMPRPQIGQTISQGIGYHTADRLLGSGAPTQVAGIAAGSMFDNKSETNQANSLAAAGWSQNADGTWTHSNTGKTVDETGTTFVGGGETEVPDPTDPTVNPPGTETGEDGEDGLDTLGGASAEAIEARINALTAQYGLDLESIAALGGEIGAQARFLMAQLQRDQGFAQEDLEGNLVGRGVFRSGITARDTGRLQGDFAARRAQVEMNKGQQLRQLAERAGIAKAGLARGKADVISEIDRANLPAELRQVMLNELNSLTPEQIQQAIDKSRPQHEKFLELTDEDLRNRQTVGASGVNLGGF